MTPSNRVVTFLVRLPLLCVLVAQAAAQAAGQGNAPIMPMAEKSLLLDISTAGERLVVAGERGHVLYSDDNGSNWQQARVPTTQMLTAIDFVDGRHGWAVGHDGLVLVSDDGGENWRIQRDGLAVQHQINLELRETAYREIEALKERLESADDETQAQLELDLEDVQLDLEDAELALEEAVFTSPFMDVWFKDVNRGWAVGAFGTLVATENGGQQWIGQEKLVDNPDEFHLNAITGDGEGRVFIAGEGGVMFRSLDDGSNWESLEPFYEGSWFGVVYSAQNDTLFMFGLRGNLYRSADFGTTWERVITDNNSTLAGGSATHQGEVVLVGGVGTVLTSIDGGQSFRRTIIEDRLSLSAGLSRNGKLILVGQGGVKLSEEVIHDK